MRATCDRVVIFPPYRVNVFGFWSWDWIRNLHFNNDLQNNNSGH